MPSHRKPWREVYLVYYHIGQHWGLFIPKRPGGTFGVLFHVNVDLRGSSGIFRRGGTAQVVDEDFQIRKPRHNPLHFFTDSRAFLLEDTSAKFDVLDEIANEVVQSYHYSVFSENCQFFVLEVIRRLEQRGHAPPGTMERARRKSPLIGVHVASRNRAREQPLPPRPLDYLGERAPRDCAQRDAPRGSRHGRGRETTYAQSHIGEPEIRMENRGIVGALANQMGRLIFG